MAEEFLLPQPISLLTEAEDPALKQGLEWWEHSGGVIGTDGLSSRILENMQISVIQREDLLPPLIHAGSTSVTAIVFGNNWAESCTGSTLPDETFDLTVTEDYIKVLEENKPLLHNIIAPLKHPEKGNCIVNYQRLLLPCTFKSGGNVIGSVTHLNSFAVVPDTPDPVAPSKPTSR